MDEKIINYLKSIDWTPDISGFTKDYVVLLLLAAIIALILVSVSFFKRRGYYAFFKIQPVGLTPKIRWVFPELVYLVPSVFFIYIVLVFINTYSFWPVMILVLVTMILISLIISTIFETFYHLEFWKNILFIIVFLVVPILLGLSVKYTKAYFITSVMMFASSIPLSYFLGRLQACTMRHVTIVQTKDSPFDYLLVDIIDDDAILISFDKYRNIVGPEYKQLPQAELETRTSKKLKKVLKVK